MKLNNNVTTDVFSMDVHIQTSRVQHISDLHSKFALGPRHV